MDSQIFLHDPVGMTAQLGPNPPLLDILDADMAHEPYVDLARRKITVRGAARAAAYAELLLNSLEISK